MYINRSAVRTDTAAQKNKREVLAEDGPLRYCTQNYSVILDGCMSAALCTFSSRNRKSESKRHVEPSGIGTAAIYIPHHMYGSSLSTGPPPSNARSDDIWEIPIYLFM